MPTLSKMSGPLLRGAAIGVVALAVAAAAAFLWQRSAKPAADPDNAAQVALGRKVYGAYCMSCHGDKLQGQPDWQRHKPDGRLPAPPHDASGHTWHHPDDQLFGMVKRGIAPYAPPGYATDMRGFGDVLTDEQIWAVLAFIKQSWPADIRARQQRLNEAQTRRDEAR